MSGTKLTNESFGKLASLSGAFGVSGCEEEVASLAAELLAPYMDRVEIDTMHNVSGYKACGLKDAPKLLLDAHIDQIGMMVTGVDEAGFVTFFPNGMDLRMMPGLPVVLRCADGTKLKGAISTDYSDSVPLGTVPEFSDLRIDVGLTAKEAKKRVQVGDYITFVGPLERLGDSFVCGPALDDRAAFFTILQTLELFKNEQLCCDLIVQGTVKEELRLQGAACRAYIEQPDLAIALDVCHAKTTDALPADSTFTAGEGPVIAIGPHSRASLARWAMACAKQEEIPYRVMSAPRSSGTNAGAIRLAGSGVRTLVVYIPVRYMHTPMEVLHLCDVEQTAQLLAKLCRDFKREVCTQ